MTPIRAPIVEADLHAFVDGEQDAARRAEVYVHLHDHPDDAAWIESYRLQSERLHELFDGVLDQPVPEAVSRALERPRSEPARTMWLRAAAALALFLAGAGAGWFLHGVQREGGDWIMRFADHASAAHRVYVSEVRHPVEVAASEEDHLVAWLSKRLGHVVRAPHLADLGFQLVGGRLLPAAGGRPAAQFMYEDTSGRRLTLYVRVREEPGRIAFRFARHDGLAMFYWIDDPFAYALVGETDREELLKGSRLVYEQLSP